MAEETESVLYTLDDADDVKKCIQESPAVVVMFMASWCKPCKTSKPIIDNAAKKAGAIVLQVDVDNFIDFVSQPDQLMKLPTEHERQLYGEPFAQQILPVKAVPTIFLVSKGVAVHRVDGAITESDVKDLNNQLEALVNIGKGKMSTAAPQIDIEVETGLKDEDTDSDGSDEENEIFSAQHVDSNTDEDDDDYDDDESEDNYGDAPSIAKVRAHKFLMQWHGPEHSQMRLRTDKLLSIVCLSKALHSEKGTTLMFEDGKSITDNGSSVSDWIEILNKVTQIISADIAPMITKAL